MTGVSGVCHRLHMGVCHCWQGWSPRLCVLRFRASLEPAQALGCVSSSGSETSDAACKGGRAGENTSGTVLGTALGTSVSSRSSGSFPLWLQDPGNHPVSAQPELPTAAGFEEDEDEEGRVPALQHGSEGSPLSPPACRSPGGTRAPSLPQVQRTCRDAGKELTSLQSDRLINFGFLFSFEAVKPMPVPGM